MDGTMGSEIASHPSVWLSEEAVTVRVSGCSMEPLLEEGDRVDVVRASPDRVKPGDLLVFAREGELVVHRFLLRGRARFLEKGDAQSMGNWHRWPDDFGVVVSILKGEERMELLRSPWPKVMRASARKHLRVHRIYSAALRIPGGFTRRAFLRMTRPLLRT